MDMITYRVVRSKRKTMAIYITKDATVEVRAPLQIPETEIAQFVQSRTDWISTHLVEMQQRCANRAAFSLGFGDRLLLRGREYPLIGRQADRFGFDGKCFYLPSDVLPEEILPLVIRIYKRMARQVIVAKVDAYSGQMGLTPSAVKVNSAKTRWGSCSGKNSLNFSWRLVMAPDRVIDYVVVHELAHIKQHNHSDRFWAIVQGVLPDYRQRQNDLKILQERLVNENWDE